MANNPSLAECINCGERAPVHQMLTITTTGMPIVRICPQCQDAQKVRITLDRDDTPERRWRYYQYSVLES